MKTRKDHSRERGAILVIVMVVLVAFTILLFSLLQMSKDNAILAVDQVRTAQARWIAEAGLEKAIAMIRASSTYRDGPLPSFSENFEGDPSRYYAVTISAVDGPGSLERTYTITSYGTVSNAASSVTAGVEVELVGAPGVEQVLLPLGGVTDIKSTSSSSIDGNIHLQNGTMTVGDNAHIQGVVTADDNSIVTGVDYEEVDEIIFSHLDPGGSLTLVGSGDTYNDGIAYASDTNNAGVIVGPYSGPFDLGVGGTIYVNGKVEIDAEVTGSGNIVATGNIEFTKNSNKISAGVEFVAGNEIDVSANKITFGENTVLFAGSAEGGKVILGGNQNFPAKNLAVLSMGDIDVKAGVTGFNGIMIAEGKIYTFEGTQSITGTIIAWQGFDIYSNLKLSYDASVFANFDLGVDYGDNFARTARLLWQETPFE